MSDAAPRHSPIAIIASHYPYVSHLFIQREVLALRRAGAEVHTFTVHRAAPEDLRSDLDRAEDTGTFALLPTAPGALLAAHLSALLRAPRRYRAALGLALRLGGRNPRPLLWHLFYFVEAALLWRECRRRGIRHLHAHHANVASDVALLAVTLGGPSWSWSFTLHGPTELFDAPAHRLAEKGALADRVICISDHARSQLMALCDPSSWERFDVVHCGVPAADFAAPSRDGTPARTAPGSALRVLTIGQAVPRKGQALLVEAVAQLTRRGLPVTLRIAGDGPVLPELRSLAAQHGLEVEFLGAVGGDALPGLLADADVFALPSLAEGVPVVLMEAMAAGVPVVATRIAGVPELVTDGVSGLLVPPGRAAPLAAALEQLARDPDLRPRLAAAARERVRAEFDVDASARRMLRLLAQVQR